jgi:hypothetical protein
MRVKHDGRGALAPEVFIISSTCESKKTMTKNSELKREKEIERLFVSLKNFLTLGYDAKYQKTESAIEQLTKLRKLARRKLITTK